MRSLEFRGMVVVAALLAGAAGCKKDEEPAATIEPNEEMQQAIAVTADVVTANMLGSELTNTAADETEQRTRAANCPAVLREVGSVTLDYGTGCVPSSGLIPGEVSGSVALDVNRIQKSIAGQFDQLTYDGMSLDGSVSASYQWLGLGQGTDLADQLSMTFVAGPTTIGVEQDVTVNIRPTHITVDGTIDYDDGLDSFVLDVAGIQWNYADLVNACPLPVDGTISVSWLNFTVRLTFDAESPSTGLAYLESGALSGDVDVCAYWYGYF